MQAYLLHLHRDRKLSASTCNVAVSGLRFFYGVTLRRPNTTFLIPAARQSVKRPHILNREELGRLFSSTHLLKHRALFLTAYASGLRVSELVALKTSDIDADRMVIRVEQGKGARDRTTILSPRLLELLRTYWQSEKPTPWLFPARHGKGHLCTRGATWAYVNAKRRAGVSKPGGIHTLRHSLAQMSWLEARRADLLPVDYFHVVFTLPHELNRLALFRPRIVYDLLFRAASDTLATFAKDPKRLGGTLAITSILHTWGQNLSLHPHFHCVVTGGALAADRARWIPKRSRPLPLSRLC